MRNFYAGFLTTCGLMNVGSPCIDNGETHGLHGRISNTPAEEVYSGTEWIEGKPVLKVSGRMREARVFGENIILHREIICLGGDHKITIRDTLENNGFRKEPFMLLYHFNMGYPILDENSYLVVPILKVEPRDEEAQKELQSYHVFQKPTPDYLEQVFYHDLKTTKDGDTCAALINDELGLGVVIRFNKNQLFNLTEWKQLGEGEYVLGIEPGNCYVGGREDAKNKGVLEYLEPGEARRFELKVEILEGAADIDRIKHEISTL